MGHIELQEAAVADMNAQQWDAYATNLTDDFTYSGDTFGSTLDKQGYLALLKALFAAAPDLHIGAENVRDEGETSYGTFPISGTQTGALALSGLPPIPATGKHFSYTLDGTSTWRGDQVSSMTLKTVGPGLLEQLGVQLPG